MCFHSWGCMNGASWMKATRRHKCAENSDYTKPFFRLAVSLLCFLELVKITDRRASSARPVRVVRFGGADAVEPGEGRHPTSALKKRTSASRRGCGPRHTSVQSHWSIEATAEVVSLLLPTHRGWLTRIHRGPRRIVFSLIPPVYVCSWLCWFMIGRLIGNVSQRVPSLLYRVSQMMKPQVVFVLGGPGAGKGTQCSKIVEVAEMAREKTMKTVGLDC